MEFSLVPYRSDVFLNFIYLGLASSARTLTALFNTRGNTMIKESVASTLDIRLLDDDYIDDKKTYKRAILSNLEIGGLKLNEVPTLLAKDEAFDLGKDPDGKENACDMVLGWNVISQFAWRGDFKNGRFEVQTSDFTKACGKKQNQPIISIDLLDTKTKAAIDTSRPFTIVASDIFSQQLAKDRALKDNLSMLGEELTNVEKLRTLTFKIDNQEVIIPGAFKDSALDQTDIKVVFGVDLLHTTKWSIYGPMNYVRISNY